MSNIPEEDMYLDDENPDKFIALIGGEAVKELLKRVDPERTYYRLKKQLKEETSQQKKTEINSPRWRGEALRPGAGPGSGGRQGFSARSVAQNHLRYPHGTPDTFGVFHVLKRHMRHPRQPRKRP